MGLLQYIIHVAGSKTTWKLQLEQYVAVHEINSVGTEARSTTTFPTLNFPPIFKQLQSGSDTLSGCVWGRHRQPVSVAEVAF